MASMLNVTSFPGTASFTSCGWVVILGGSAECENTKQNAGVTFLSHKILKPDLLSVLKDNGST